MRIFIDADGCPVTESAINFAKQLSREIRMSGGRTKGPHKRKDFQNEDFLRSLKSLIENK